MEGKSLKRFMKDIYHRAFIEEDIFDLSAQLAFYFMMAFFPFLLVILSILVYFPIKEEALIHLLTSQAPNDVASLISDNVKQVLQNRREGLLSIGIVLSLWSTSGAMHAVMRALNKAYGVGERRHYFKDKALSLLFTITMLLAIGIMLVLPLLQEVLPAHGGIQVTKWIGTTLLLFLFMFLYNFAPNISLSWRSILPGSVFAIAMWKVTSEGFRYFVTNFNNFSATYGSLGVIIILLIWFYLIGMSIIVGGVINASIRKSKP
jgi:membrane protein